MLVKRADSTGSVSGNTILICFTSIVVVAIGALVAVFLAGGNDSNTIARAGIITGFVGILLPQLLLLVRQDRVSDVVQSVKEDTHDILNGAGQLKIETAIHNVLDERGVGSPPTSV